MPKSGYLFLLLTAIALGTAGCAKTQDANQAALNPAGDPAADGNLAPVSDTTQPGQPQYQNQPQQAPAPNYSQPPAGYANNYPPPAAAQGNYQDYPADDYQDSSD